MAAIKSPDTDRLVIAANGDGAERSRRPHEIAEGGDDRVRDNEGRIVLLGEALEPRGEIDRIANNGELLAPRRADRADDRRTEMETDADPKRPAAGGEPAPVDLG